MKNKFPIAWAATMFTFHELVACQVDVSSDCPWNGDGLNINDFI